MVANSIRTYTLSKYENNLERIRKLRKYICSSQGVGVPRRNLRVSTIVGFGVECDGSGLNDYAQIIY
jgi:hypothetical protein